MGTPGVGSAYLRIGVFTEFLGDEALNDWVAQNFITVYLTVHIEIEMIKSLFNNNLIGSFGRCRPDQFFPSTRQILVFTSF